jgi:hypothetical protein
VVEKETGFHSFEHFVSGSGPAGSPIGGQWKRTHFMAKWLRSGKRCALRAKAACRRIFCSRPVVTTLRGVAAIHNNVPELPPILLLKFIEVFTC